MHLILYSENCTLIMSQKGNRAINLRSYVYKERNQQNRRTKTERTQESYKQT